MTARAEAVYRSRHILPPVVIPILVVVAIAGYILGIHRAPAASVVAPAAGSGSASVGASGEGTRIASGAGILLEYPMSWQPAGSAPAIPGLTLTHTLALAPGGDSAHAGVLSGQLPAGEPAPLPAAFVALVHGIPHTEVVSLLNTQAYRYRGLTGYDRTLDLYVIPNPGNGPTALVCYASKELSADLAQCEQIVAKLTLVGQSPEDLSPDAGYARQLATLIGTLDGERLPVRREMSLGKGPAAVHSLATAMAARLATTAASLVLLEPPLPAGAAQAALAAALLQARAAYTGLAAAAAGGNPVDYEPAELRVEQAEAGVNGALEGFALIGYGPT